MTKGEVATVLGTVRMAWPHSKLSAGNETAAQLVDFWHSMLEPYPAALVEEALREMVAGGREHAPLIGSIVAVVSERVVDAPEWDQAWAEVVGLVHRFGSYRVPPVEAFSHEAVAAFAIPAWTELCMGPAPGTNGYGTHVAQQREAYKALRARATRDVGLHVLGAPRARSGELRRLSPAELLPGAGS